MWPSPEPACAEASLHSHISILQGICNSVILRSQKLFKFLICYGYNCDSKECDDLSLKTRSRYSISLRSLSQPMSLKEMVKTWDVCARAVIADYAQQSGGGTFSSRYGTWKKCVSATWWSFTQSLFTGKGKHVYVDIQCWGVMNKQSRKCSSCWVLTWLEETWRASKMTIPILLLYVFKKAWSSEREVPCIYLNSALEDPKLKCIMWSSVCIIGFRVQYRWESIFRSAITIAYLLGTILV